MSRIPMWILPAAVALAMLLPALASAAPAPPRLLSETGLYRRGTREVLPANRPYSPQYPLWTDGAAKERWVFLPKGAKIDTRELDSWRFPVGTKFWKQFSFGPKKVETRLLWRATRKDWVLASYLWNEAGTEAELAPAGGVVDYAEIPETGRKHSIPSVEDCRNCHENGRMEVLGFGPIQLSDDRDPMAPHAEPLREGMVTLRTLVEEKRLTPPRARLATSPPRIPAGSPVARAALGYLSSNCGSCHQPQGMLEYLELDLRHSSGAGSFEGEPAVRTTFGVTGQWEIPGVSASKRIAPGDPDRSSVLHRMAAHDPATRMPPLGTVIPDAEAIALLRRFVAESAESR